MKTVAYVDGFKIRNTLDNDFAVLHEYSNSLSARYPKYYIPKDEIWIDNRYRKETDLLLEIEKYYANPANAAEIKSTRNVQSAFIDEERSFIKNLCLPPPIPNFIIRSERLSSNTFIYVDGSMVRKYIDPEFVLGGHDFVYSYIPKDQIWIDMSIDPKEIKYIKLHESFEREAMSKDKKSYDIAHEIADAIDKEARIKDGLGSYPAYTYYIWRSLSNQDIIQKYYISKPETKLPVRPFLQSSGYCGPASLKILLSYFGKDFSEEQLAKLCSATKGLGRGTGTEHEGLIKAVKEIGAYVFTKEDGTIEELEYFVREEKLPAIIGWFDKNGDHYSVLVSVTEKNIIIVDPATTEPERWLDRKNFSDIWFDFIGSDDKIVSWRWYMIVNFQKKKYKVVGGHYF